MKFVVLNSNIAIVETIFTLLVHLTIGTLPLKTNDL